MGEPGGPYDFVYVHTDIPEGMTIREWRAQRAAERVAAQVAAREDRRRRWAAFLRLWLVVLGAPVRRARVRSREAHG